MKSGAVIAPVGASAFTILEFCRRNAISRAFFYKMSKAGQGPQDMKIGSHSRISAEAECDWKREREAVAATKQNRPTHVSA